MTEGIRTVTTVTASGTPTATYSIVGGEDYAKFVIDSVTGALAFASVPDYENPTDANLDEDYIVQVAATNSVGTAVQTITVALRNSVADDVIAPTNQALLQVFQNYGIVGSEHFGLETYTTHAQISSEWGTGAIDVNNFNPPLDFSFLPYLQYMKDLGCKAVMLTTKHLGGFALWPSDVDADYCITDTAWYQQTGIGLVQMFCDQAQSLGLDVGFYFCVYDAHQSLKAGGVGVYNGEYRTAIYGEIQELVTHYDPKFILLDGWGDTWPQFGGPAYADIPYSTMMRFIRNLNPNLLITVNDHELYAYGDFQTYEGPAQGEPLATGKPILYWQPIQPNGDSWWFTHSDNPVENVAADIALNAGRRNRTLANGNVWGVNVSVGPTGVLPDDLREIVQGLSLTAGDYTQNGTVDAADYVAWRASLAASVTPGTGADGDGSGIIDDADYAAWRANFGNTVPAASGSGESMASATTEMPQADVAETSDDAIGSPEVTLVVELVASPSENTTAEAFAQLLSAPDTLGRAEANSLLRLSAPPLNVADDNRRLGINSRSISHASAALSASKDQALMAWIASALPDSEPETVRTRRERLLNDPAQLAGTDPADDEFPVLQIPLAFGHGPFSDRRI